MENVKFEISVTVFMKLALPLIGLWAKIGALKINNTALPPD